MIIEEIRQEHSALTVIRRDIHAHPELKFEEYRTSDLVAAKLAELGIDVHQGLGRTGVVGTLRRGTSDKAIALRADMDALPMQEKNNFAHRSTCNGKMHACGHDGHTAILLGAAQYLAKCSNFDGTVHLIFQPAEEGGGGAREMIKDGLFELFPCDMIFGLHNFPGYDEGKFGFRSGPAMASSNSFDILIHGKGAHAAEPHKGIDPVLIATHVVQALQSLITRNRNPIDMAVLSVTQIHAGDAYNVVPDEAVIRGTVRTFSSGVLDMIEAGMRCIVETLPVAFGAAGTLNFSRQYPPLVNSPEATAFAADVAESVFGAENVERNMPPITASEDFSFYLEKVPGCFLKLGVGGGEHRAPMHGEGPCTLHNPSYDFNDAVIPTGATYWVRLVETYLQAI